MNGHLLTTTDRRAYLFPAACFAFPLLVISWRMTKSTIRRRRIRAKYGDTEIADRIIKRHVWAGETVEQVVDSLGQPAAVDEKRMFTKVRHTLKYYRRGRTRYGLRIVVENGRVAAWDIKRN